MTVITPARKAYKQAWDRAKYMRLHDGMSPAPRPAPTVTGLSPREFEVLRMGIDLTTPVVAHDLGISRNTVHHHITSAYEKLGVISRPEAIAYLDDWEPGWRPRRPKLS